MFYRIKFFIAYFLILIFILSVSQIIIDAYWENKSPDGTAVKGASSAGNYSIFIEIEDKTLYLLENGKCIKEYTIASGKSYSPSPIGCWKIVDKGDWGEGFGGRWMGLDVPWGTV